MKNFHCERCGQCCRTPRLYKSDIQRIKKANLAEKDFLYTDNFGNTYIQEKKGWCIFLKRKKNKTFCVIYPARPRICRQYPSEIRNNSCKPIELAFDRFLEKKKR
jgi:Fe-S-cluster containining protein